MVAGIGRPATCECGACPKCKHRTYMRKWYQAKTPDERRAWIALRNPETTRRNDRTRYERDKDKRQASCRAYCSTPAGKLAVSRAEINYRLRYPEKYRANTAVHNAIRNGKLIREPCEMCGDTKHVHGHHDDYTQPLDVRWMCRLHHVDWHRKMREATP